jgi:hypothetical protein
MLEEAYPYGDMPEPAFGIQLVYTDARTPELAVVVRANDCVLMPEGYHPNVAAPGGPINFLWIMAANREDVDRQFGVVNVQPEFAAGGSGIEKRTCAEVMNAPIDAAPTRWDDVPARRIAEGIERQMIVGERQMICRLTLGPRVDTPVHSHPHEQMTLVGRGPRAEVVLIDIFTPIREDFPAP